MRKSSVGDEDGPQLLESLDLPGIAKYIKSDACKRIFVMAGAGISTSAGIPDFRSPDTGLYIKLTLPRSSFRYLILPKKPTSFLRPSPRTCPREIQTHPNTLLHPPPLRKRIPTHVFHPKHRYTRTSRRRTPTKIIEAHGSFADQHCIECGARYPDEKIKKKIREQEIPVCEKRGCKGYVKPDIVFFGESLPPSFFSGIQHLRTADLLIVMGTSLTVHPFASLTEIVPEDCPRVLLNLDHVGNWGSRRNDVECLMACDRAVRELCGLLGWGEELEGLWEGTGGLVEEEGIGGGISVGGGGGGKENRDKEKEKEGKKKKKDEKEKEKGARDGKKVNEEFLNDIVDKLAKQVEQTSLEEKGEGPRNPASASTPTPTLSPTSGAVSAITTSTATTSNTLSTSSDRVQGGPLAPIQTQTQLPTQIEKRDKIGEGEGEEETKAKSETLKAEALSPKNPTTTSNNSNSNSTITTSSSSSSDNGGQPTEDNLNNNNKL
ncbi:NAD-dependent deacetylase sirtuin-2 [Pyrrhoderma noxium]|uniref:NAD-dependent deacetylase sirtuin-2 n=1 Tax=Pyrrhoderma noxium TaxID=2282107 RepID=A0A286UC38_9AGAM|nr:NAD-dependent deacetylase sirtuin-2 [Pyrrhoderma noxium]